MGEVPSEFGARAAAGIELPIKFDGFEVGKALIFPGGSMVAVFNLTDVSEELQERIFGGATRSISITPRNT